MSTTKITLPRPTRYTFVSATCAGLHNVIIFIGDKVGLHYALSTLISLGIVGLVGYLAHSRWVFPGTRGGVRSLAHYYLMASANIPLSLAGMFMIVDVIGASVPIAALMVTMVLFAWNYLATHWIMRTRPYSLAQAENATSKWRDISFIQRPAWFPSEDVIQRFLASHQSIYSFRKPGYQIQFLADLARLLPNSVSTILDIGAGSGLMGQTITSLFPHKAVVGVDVNDRFLSTLSIPHAIFGGTQLPFENAAFDGVLLCNVLHHVPVGHRTPLLQEALRVAGGGPLLIKDHLAEGWLARPQLTLLDWIGNVPFGGMVKASYLDAHQWIELFRELDCDVETITNSPYRKGLWKSLFPNKLEIFFRATPRRSTTDALVMQAM